MFLLASTISGSSTVFERFLFFFVIFLIVFAFIGPVQYLIYSIGLYKMGKRAGIKNSWLVFIPPLNGYIIGKILGPNRVRFLGQNITNPEIIIPLTPFIMGITTSLASWGSGGAGVLFYIIFVVVNLLGTIFLLVCNYQLLKMYKGDDAKILFILSLVFPIIWPFLIFSMRNADPVDSVYNYDDYNDYYYTE